MQEFFKVAFPFILAFLPLFITVRVVGWSRKRYLSRKKHPINVHLLRAPGQTIIETLEEIDLKMFSYLASIIYTPLFFYILYLQTDTEKVLMKWVWLFMGGACFVGFVFNIFKCVDEKSKLSLGYDAELAVGQELNQLMHAGYWVFHDLQLGKYNIDHVVVGNSGVFAIETKGRSKPLGDSGKFEYRVSFDGKKLHFPSWIEEQPAKQARRQASSLQAELTRAVGVSFKVKPVLVIPGWFTKITAKSDVMLINGKNCQQYFDSTKGYALDSQLVDQIAYQLEQRCRNVNAESYGKVESTD